MASEQLIVSAQDSPDDLSLRLAAFGDLDNLRNWKNDHRQFFFHKEIISPEQHAGWFRNHLLRSDDYMFIVALRGSTIGCMGVRLLEDDWDVYNVILGDAGSGRRGYMSRALRLMLAFARGRRACPIQLRVLKENPAVGWYEKNGFSIVADCDDHHVMRYDLAIDPDFSIVLSRP